MTPEKTLHLGLIIDVIGLMIFGLTNNIATLLISLLGIIIMLIAVKKLN